MSKSSTTFANEDFEKNKPALILIDIQKGFENIEYWRGPRNNPDAELNASKLLKHKGNNKLPLFHIQHCSSNCESLLHKTKEGNGFKEMVTLLDDEPSLRKM